MNIDRQNILDAIESFRPIIENPVLRISPKEKYRYLKTLEEQSNTVRYARYRVTVLGAFSSGKSTFLNALLQTDLLPSSDLATTAIITELYAAPEDHFFIPFLNTTPPPDLLDDFKDSILQFCKETPFQVLEVLNRDGVEYPGLGARFEQGSGDALRALLKELTAEQQRSQKRFSKLKKLLNREQSLPIWVGTQSFPEELRDVVITDAPGLGSISDSHEVIINRIIPHTHLVLYVVDSTKPGSSVDLDLTSRISNNMRRKIFYLLNKIDQQNEDERAETEFVVKSSIAKIEPEGEQPEFLRVSGLQAFLSAMLYQGRMSPEQVCRIPKMNPFSLMDVDVREFLSDTIDNQRALLSDSLMRSSLFHDVMAKVTDYLQNENKDFKLAASPLAFIGTLSQNMLNRCTRAKKVFESGMNIKELQDNQQQAQECRIKCQADINESLDDFTKGALKSDNSYAAIIQSRSSGAFNSIYNDFAQLVNDNQKVKEFTKSGSTALQQWLQERLNKSFKGIREAVDEDFRKRMKDLLNKVYAMAVKIDNTNMTGLGAGKPATIDKSELSIDIPMNTGGAVFGGALSGGALAAGGTYLATSIAGLGVVVTTTPVTLCAASGLAGWLSSMGLSTMAGWAASMGAGSVGVSSVITTTTSLWGLPAIAVFGPIILLGAAVLATLAYFGVARLQRKKLLEGVQSKLQGIIFDGYADSEGNQVKGFCPQTIDNVEESIKVYMGTIRRLTEERIDDLKTQEDLILKEIESKKEENERAVQELDQLCEHIKNTREDALKTLSSY